MSDGSPCNPTMLVAAPSPKIMRDLLDEDPVSNGH
jgi:hypothetical protein